MNTTFFREAADFGGSGGGMSEIEMEAERFSKFFFDNERDQKIAEQTYYNCAIKYSFDNSELKREVKKLKSQIENAFNESRLTHPMMGFKHNTFDEYSEWYNTSQHKK